MGTIYVLMFFWMADSNWRPATMIAEFNSPQACESAGTAAMARLTKSEMIRKATYLCAPK